MMLNGLVNLARYILAYAAIHLFNAKGNGSTICKPNSRHYQTHSFVAIRHQRKYWQGKHTSSNCFGARKQTSLHSDATNNKLKPLETYYCYQE
ncbi:hypothetical protein ACB092_07G077900 [Castanea dentata]